MTPELKNRIHDELVEMMNREPHENEIINAQNDHVIMGRVRDRVNIEEMGQMQDQITSLQAEVTAQAKPVNSPA